ncbi:MAG: histidine kinase [Anaerolineae bacterium]|nr:histidine kinase [Anaerolineae bacterium]
MNLLLILLNAIGAGVCFLAAVLHLAIGWRSHPRSSVQLLFGMTSLLVGAYFLTVINVQAYQDGVTANLPGTALLINIVLSLIFPIVYTWFVAGYTGVKPRWFLFSVTVCYSALTFGVLLLPSAESLFAPGQLSGFRIEDPFLSLTLFGWLLLYVCVYFGYSTIAVITQYRRGEKADALTIGFAIFVFQLTAVVDAVSIFALPNAIFVGQFGFIAFIVVMSLQLTGKTVESERQVRRLNLDLENRVALRTSELSAANDALAASQASINAQYQAIPIPTFTWQQRDGTLILIDYNQAARSLMQNHTEAAIGRTAAQIYEDMPDIVIDLQQCIARGGTLERESTVRDYETGETRILAMTYTFVPPDLVLVHAEDVSGQRRAEEMLRAAAVTAERQRLARDLHDSVTQSLYSLTLLSSGWKSMAEQGRLDDPAPSFQQLGDVGLQALREMRLMIHQLRSPILEELGLVQALQKRLDTVESRAGIEAELLVEGDVDQLPIAMENELFNIAQEALNNSLRHASASTVAVSLSAEDHVVALSIADDGKGFEPAQVGSGLGLATMRERAEAAGGSFVLQSESQKGTTVRIAVPRST